MTQRNIDTMDVIVDLLAQGRNISDALYHVYNRRHLMIPFTDEILDVGVRDLNLSPRTINALLRAHLATLRDVVNYCSEYKITDVKTLGSASGIELFEKILDYCWGHMSNDMRTDFLIDVVQRNEKYIKI